MPLCKKLTESRIFMLTAFVGLLTGCEQPKPEAPPEDAAITGDRGQASYTLAYAMGRSVLEQYPDELDIDAFASGIEDGMRGSEQQVAETAGRAALDRLLQGRRPRAQKVASSTDDEGKAFLEANGQRSEVVTLPSGLQYEVLVAGEGARPAATDTVTTHYEGSLIDGSVFDSSVERGTPASFALNRVIRGWTEALQLMSVGSKWRLFIPPDLAYGARGAPPSIPADATLIFEVELLSID